MELNRFKKCIQVGNKAEERFYNIALSNGYDVRKSTRFQNCMEHTDFYITKDGKTLSVDVKAMKKINKKDWYTQDKYLWLELFNYKYKGWLYCENLNVIATETKEGFLLLDRLKLVEYVKNNVSNEWIYKTEEAYLKTYVRVNYNNKGVSRLTLVKIEDLPSDIIIMNLF